MADMLAGMLADMLAYEVAEIWRMMAEIWRMSDSVFHLTSGLNGLAYTCFTMTVLLFCPPDCLVLSFAYSIVIASMFQPKDEA